MTFIQMTAGLLFAHLRWKHSASRTARVSSASRHPAQPENCTGGSDGVPQLKSGSPNRAITVRPIMPPMGLQKLFGGLNKKKWLKDSLLASNADWKIVFNPDPVIGPDHKNKADNHADPVFATEGHEIRKFLRDNLAGRVILTNGDRLWQYHSVDPESGLHEFGCGPASDVHAVSPSEGRDPRYHKLLRIKGGFLVLRVNPGDRQNHLTIEHRDVMGSVVYRRVYRRPDLKTPWA